MNNVLISLTARQLLGRRRTLVIGLLLALPILIAVIYRFSDEAGSGEATEEVALGMVSVMIFTLCSPWWPLYSGPPHWVPR